MKNIKRIDENFASIFNYDNSYPTRVRRDLSDIIATEHGISEKSFQRYDHAIEIAKKIVEEENDLIKKYEEKKSRSQLCAEIIFEKHVGNIKEQIHVED
jgi:hypothetical protein